MFEFDITKLVPKFLREDRNGNAMMRAIEAGMRYFLDAAQEALDTWHDPSKMPEWRLDELAWEYGIVYDNDADVDTKRNWIANAIDFYQSYGTADGLAKYLSARFGTVNIEEWWQYNGQPYHFRVTVGGVWDESASAWAVKAINEVKNVRSELDEISVSSEDSISAVLTGAGAGGVEVSVTSTTIG